MTDPHISQQISYQELWKLIDNIYITGGKEQLTDIENKVVASKISQLQIDNWASQSVCILSGIFESNVYINLYEEFVNITTNKTQIPDYSNVHIEHYHQMADLPLEERFSLKNMQEYLPEIASQFRPKDVIIRILFNGYIPSNVLCLE